MEPFLPTGSGSLENDPGVPGIQISADDTLTFARYLPVEKRSITFGMTPDQSFAVEGLVLQFDFNLDPGNWDYVYLGGIDGLKAEKQVAGGADEQQTETFRPIFRGADLLAETSAFIDVTIPFTQEESKRLTGASGDGFAGHLSFTIFIG